MATASSSARPGHSRISNLTVANGSMGAGYGDGVVFGQARSLTYQQSVSFAQNGGAFVLDLQVI
jgi:hypothetical protein